MQAKTINVRILNESSGIGEKIVRLGLGGHTGTSLLRSAILTVRNENIEINYTDDVGSSITVGSILQQNIRKVRLKKSAISPKTQLIKPALSGAFLGVVLAVAIFRQDGSMRGSVDNVLLSLCLVLFSVAFFVLKSLFSASRSHLAVVTFDSTDGKSLEVAIEDDKADSLIALFAQHEILVEEPQEKQLGNGHLTDLLTKKKLLQSEMRKLVQLADAENRDMSDIEKSKFDNLEKEVASLISEMANKENVATKRTCAVQKDHGHD